MGHQGSWRGPLTAASTLCRVHAQGVGGWRCSSRVPSCPRRCCIGAMQGREGDHLNALPPMPSGTCGKAATQPSRPFARPPRRPGPPGDRFRVAHLREHVRERPSPVNREVIVPAHVYDRACVGAGSSTSISQIVARLACSAKAHRCVMYIQGPPVSMLQPDRAVRAGEMRAPRHRAAEWSDERDSTRRAGKQLYTTAEQPHSNNACTMVATHGQSVQSGCRRVAWRSRLPEAAPSAPGPPPAQ